MMTSSNGYIFRVTGRLCGEFTGPRWIPGTKASDAELRCFLWSAPEKTVEYLIVRLVILRRHRAHYDAILMYLAHLLLPYWIQYRVISDRDILSQLYIGLQGQDWNQFIIEYIYIYPNNCYEKRLCIWNNPFLCITMSHLIVFDTIFWCGSVIGIWKTRQDSLRSTWLNEFVPDN